MSAEQRSKSRTLKIARFQSQNMDFKKVLDIIVFTLYV